YMSGAAVYLSDTDNPGVLVNATPLTSGWIDGNQTTTYPVTLSDGGLGLAGVIGPGPNGNQAIHFPNESSPCVGTHANSCPQSGNATFGYYPGKAPEGQSLGFVWAYDALGHSTVPTWNIRVDASAPQIS